ncbi:MAG TPA: cupin domain-containing protein [Paraburkholderia sp.]|uniref:cupin domain-containing protein n=1 Tax=Burkholderia metallica TaxID=488729 RepID=UPI000B764155|nr:cupin domain-containing protein [Burkholderia metallica]OUE41138.1 anti-sigma factor [Burkholderia territorii]HDR9502530.1 cupin domain-containing protein [Burkholderia cepacia]HKT97592.1 cupin domain-containing protein [Paraburkholderia sp.]
MLVNADFSRRVVVAPHQYRWVASPQAGVERVMLDRLGGEQARATSIVRYAPASCFPTHLHPEGEEILVLSGTFSEDGVHYPAGWYLRNPPGSSHRPSSSEGTIIFVKLRHMRPSEHRRIRIDTNDPAAWHHCGGRAICPLFADDTEQVCLQRLAPHEALFSAPLDSAEVLVLAGEVVDGIQPHEHGSWMRLPKGTYPEIVAGAGGASVYLKTGHPVGTAVED